MLEQWLNAGRRGDEFDRGRPVAPPPGVVLVADPGAIGAVFPNGNRRDGNARGEGRDERRFPPVRVLPDELRGWRRHRIDATEREVESQIGVVSRKLVDL